MCPSCDLIHHSLWFARSQTQCHPSNCPLMQEKDAALYCPPELCVPGSASGWELKEDRNVSAVEGRMGSLRPAAVKKVRKWRCLLGMAPEQTDKNWGPLCRWKWGSAIVALPEMTVEHRYNKGSYPEYTMNSQNAVTKKWEPRFN